MLGHCCGNCKCINRRRHFVALRDVMKLGQWWRHRTIRRMTSVTAHEIFCYCPPLYMQIISFAWLNAKIEKITTEDEWKYGFFCTILYNVYKCVKFVQLNALRKMLSVKGMMRHIGKLRGVGRVANSLYWKILPNKIPLLSCEAASQTLHFSLYIYMHRSCPCKY